MTSTAAWIAVAVSIATVVASFFGVIWAGYTQRRIAHFERIADRRVETYVELLSWIDTAEAEMKREEGTMGAFLALKLPDELRVRLTAFASDRIVRLTVEYQNSWLKARRAIEASGELIFEASRVALTDSKNRQATPAESLQAMGKAVRAVTPPEYDKASEARQRLRTAVRSELIDKRRGRFRW